MFHVEHFAQETIAAIATPLGNAGIGVVRLSGPGSLAILRSLFPALPNRTTSHKMTPGWIIDPKGKARIDQGMACFMKGPRSYTGEDTAEIYCHGGVAIMQAILGVALRAGARLATKGEFTKRAFINGKLDLAQAEAIIDLINSKTSGGVGWAVKQLEGKLSSRITQIRCKAIDLQARLEAAIDFPEDSALSRGVVRKALSKLSKEIKEMIGLAGEQRYYQQGIKVVIVGRPNVGKSRLLNALLKEERAIVTSLAGTTRDAIEETIEVEGLPILITDTAGMRSPGDEAEQAGVERTGAELSNAGMVLAVLDGSRPLNRQDKVVLSKVKGKPGVIVINKLDKGNNIGQREITKLAGGKTAVAVSAKTGEGISRLESLLANLIKRNYKPAESDPIYLNARHRQLLENANKGLQMALKSAINNMPPELIALDLKGAIVSLGEVTGEAVSEEVVNEIFSRFCIGK